MRKRCLVEETVSVVGVTAAQLDQEHTAQLRDSLPILRIDKTGHPVLPKDSGYTQVILYQQKPLEDTSFVLYQHCESREFSDAVLSRLSHSAAVLDALQQISTAPNQDTGQIETPANNEAAAHSSSRPLPQLLLRHSLFLYHITHRNLWWAFLSPQQKLCGTAICTDCQSIVPFSLQQSHYERKSQWIAASDRSTRFVGEVTVILVCLLFVARNDLSFLLVLQNWYRGHYRALTTGLEWLENVPIGLKLNESFLEAIGREVQRAWEVHEWAMEWLLRSTATHIPRWSVVAGFSTLVMTGGTAGLLAAAFDLYRLLFLHLAVFYWGSQYLFAVELRLLRSSWRLFRGKKRNPLRQRTDTMEYDSMQLLLGTVLFVTVVFLWTTICAYTVFFALLYGAAMAVPLILGCCYQLLCNGGGSLWLRLRRPGLFCHDVVLRPAGVGPCTTLLVERPASLQSLLGNCLGPPIRTLTAWSCRKLLDDVMEAS